MHLRDAAQGISILDIFGVVWAGELAARQNGT